MRRRQMVLKIILFAGSAALLINASSPLMANEGSTSRGLVFDKGKFIDPPYAVTISRGESSYEVAISGVVVDRIRDCRPAGSVTFTDPGPYSIPQGIDGLEGSTFPLYCSRLFNYLEQEYGSRQARERVIELLRSSSLVTSVEILDDGADISDKYNHKYFIPFYSQEVRVEYDSKKLAEETAASYRRHLSHGGAILMFSNGDMFVPASRVAQVIKSAASVRESGLSERERIQALEEIFNDRLMAEEFQRNYKSSETLRKLLSGYRDLGEESDAR